MSEKRKQTNCDDNKLIGTLPTPLDNFGKYLQGPCVTLRQASGGGTRYVGGSAHLENYGNLVGQEPDVLLTVFDNDTCDGRQVGRYYFTERIGGGGEPRFDFCYPITPLTQSTLPPRFYKVNNDYSVNIYGDLSS